MSTTSAPTKTNSRSSAERSAVINIVSSAICTKNVSALNEVESHLAAGADKQARKALAGIISGISLLGRAGVSKQPKDAFEEAFRYAVTSGQTDLLSMLKPQLDESTQLIVDGVIRGGEMKSRLKSFIS
jgi:hypothetical protein